MLDSLLDLRIFTRVVGTGSLSAAGRELNLSLAVVSKRLAALEERLGTRLINRTTRRLNTTEEGGALYERALHILAEVEEAEAVVTHGQTEPRGLLRVTAPAAFGRRHVASVALSLTRRHAGLRVDLDLTDRVVDLVDSGIDVAIRLGALQDSSLIARKLADNSRVVVCSPAYLAEMGEPQRPEELAGHRCLVFADGAGVWNFAGPQGPVAQKVAGPLRTNDGEAAHAWALAGAGLVLKSIWDVADDLAAGRLRRVLSDWKTDGAAIYAVYPTSRHLSTKVRVFVEAMTAWLRGSSQPVAKG
ncbi:LysR family transcriptional regulator [Telmatospirillum sp.]|uniref:LysR family transcriptional regulator n=1 Tax=Telmatospirillum sp. TaxID=2079197 RepID=UPI00283DAA63|nr:LysR family transcriptional regulator [Telmatospirillum sp.]MDR3435826.1 LysR family transcriptional regulator [Telmatospirillum sp.]